MIEVVFSDSLYGVLSMAKLGTDDLISLDFDFDIGPLYNGIFSEDRIRYLNQIHGDPWRYAGEILWDEEQMAIVKNDIQIVVNAAKSGKPIRIWYSSNPASLCGLMYVMSEISEFDCDIMLVCVSDGCGEYGAISEGVIDPEDIPSLAEMSYIITAEERNVLTQKWKMLCSQADCLRINLNGEVTSVPASFYDSFILAAIPQGDVSGGDIIARVISRINGQTSFLRWRICEVLRKKHYLPIDPQKAEKRNRCVADCCTFRVN